MVCGVVGGGGLFGFSWVLLVEVIDKFFGDLVLVIGHTEFEFSLLGTEHDGLAFHATHHVEGGARLAAQRHLQQVFFDARLDGLAQFVLDLEEAIGRAQALDALMRPLVIIVFDPEFDPLPCCLEALELRAGEELLPDRLPAPFDLAQRHRMLGTALEVRYPVLLQLGFEPADTAPGRVLPAIIGQHLLWRLKLPHTLPVYLDDRLGCRAAEQVRGGDEARVIIQEGDQIGVTSSQPEGEDVALPHLIGCRPLEEPGPGQIALLRFVSRIHQRGFVQPLPHCFAAGL